MDIFDNPGELTRSPCVARNAQAIFASSYAIDHPENVDVRSQQLRSRWSCAGD